MLTPVDWDYTHLADAYVRRPGYAPIAIDALLAQAGLDATRNIVDLGAGTAHLTALLAERGGNILALEPNNAMRAHGIARTSMYTNVRWVTGHMEDTLLEPGQFSLATCGSSFGVAEHIATMREVARILEPGGWFACLWNYRNLDDPLQREIESYIKLRIPDFQYGSRRADQTPIIEASGLFNDVRVVESAIRHLLPKTEWIDAWHSHATLQRQAGAEFDSIVDGIAAIVESTDGNMVEIPYMTRIWFAQLRSVPGSGGIG